MIWIRQGRGFDPRTDHHFAHWRARSHHVHRCDGWGEFFLVLIDELPFWDWYGARALQLAQSRQVLAPESTSFRLHLVLNLSIHIFSLNFPPSHRFADTQRKIMWRPTPFIECQTLGKHVCSQGLQNLFRSYILYCWIWSLIKALIV
jgi:hypothetical protein